MDIKEASIKLHSVGDYSEIKEIIRILIFDMYFKDEKWISNEMGEQLVLLESGLLFSIAYENIKLNNKYIENIKEFVKLFFNEFAEEIFGISMQANRAAHIKKLDR